MKKSLLLYQLFLIPFVNSYSQYKQKYFKDGYIIRLSDTIPCKIYAKEPEELQEKIAFKYKDADEPIVYHPGSIVSGFGLTLDGQTRHYTAIPHPLNKKGTKTELIYGEVITGSFLKLFKYSYTKEYLNMASLSGNSPILFVPIKTKSKKPKIDYFIYRTDIDSSSHLSTYMRDNMIKLNSELINRFFGDHPDLLKKIENEVTLAIFSQYIDEYNLWWSKRNKKQE